MPQLESIHTPCLHCKEEFVKQRTHYCREYLRYQRENFAQRSEITALEAQLKHALQKLLNAEQQAEPIGWLDGSDKLADFMHRDLKADHDKRGSATPQEFTIPVYTKCTPA